MNLCSSWCEEFWPKYFAFWCHYIIIFKWWYRNDDVDIQYLGPEPCNPVCKIKIMYFLYSFLLMQSAVIARFLHRDISKVLSQRLKSYAKQLDIFMRSQSDSAEFHSTRAAHWAERGRWKDCVLKGLGYAHFYNSIIKIDPWQLELITVFTTCCKQKGTGPFEQVTTVIPFFLPPSHNATF